MVTYSKSMASSRFACKTNLVFQSIVDRLKELIKYKGFQVPPADLEKLLLTNPKVGDVAVIGVHSREFATELPRAYVVPAGGIEAFNAKERDELSKELVSWVEQNVRLSLDGERHFRVSAKAAFACRSPITNA